jgi:fibronectin-binding autotransporter adhesin
VAGLWGPAHTTVSSGNKTLTLGGSNGTFSDPSHFAGKITNNGISTTAITKTDSGAWSLSDNNSYTGATTVAGGVLIASSLANGGSNSSLGASSNVAGNLILNGGTLRYTGEVVSIDRLFSLQGSSTISASGIGAVNFTNTGSMGFNGGTAAKILTLAGTNTGDNTIAAMIGDNVGATSIGKQGPSVWVLSGANSYTGSTTITAGVLGVSTLANGGSNSSLGKSSNAAANLVFGAPTSTLRYTGSSDVTTDRSFTMSSGVGGGATIESSGIGSLSFNNTVALAYGTTAQTRILTLGGTNTGANTFGKVIANNGSGATSVTKNGVGTWVLNQTNTYTGATSINQGILAVSGTGSINSSAVTINGGNFRNNSATNYTGALTFTSGTISGTNWGGSLSNLTIGTGQIISPGNSPGTATVTGDQTWASAGSYTWEINSTSGTAGADPGWDLINGSGTLNITALAELGFNINVTSLTLGNASGAVSDFDQSLSYNWLIADFAAVSGFSSDKFTVNTGSFTNSFTGNFGVALGNSGTIGGDNTQIWLTYTAIPEPKTALLGVLGVLLLLRRRRN